MRSWLQRLHDEVHLTSVFVTHDREEAMEVADEIVIMNQGRIEQIGTPAEIYDRPATPFVMGFISEVNILPSNNHLCEHLRDRHNNSTAFIRPHEIEIQLHNEHSKNSAIVKRIVHLGWEVQVELKLPDRTLLMAYLNREKFLKLDLKTGQLVFINPKQVKFFAESEQQIR